MSAEDNGAAVRSADDIKGWHAHVYFDAESAPVAERLRNRVAGQFDIKMGRWHEKLVGPHPRWSYQIAFAPSQFAELVSWLTLNREGLTVFIHPETGDDLVDHTDHTIWMGDMPDLNLEMFRR